MKKRGKKIEETKAYRVWNAIELEDLNGTDYEGETAEESDHGGPRGCRGYDISPLTRLKQIAVRVEMRTLLPRAPTPLQYPSFSVSRKQAIDEEFEVTTTTTTTR